MGDELVEITKSTKAAGKESTVDACSWSRLVLDANSKKYVDSVAKCRTTHMYRRNFIQGFSWVMIMECVAI